MEPTGENYNGNVEKSQTGKRCEKWDEGPPLMVGFCKILRNFDQFGNKIYFCKENWIRQLLLTITKYQSSDHAD